MILLSLQSLPVTPTVMGFTEDKRREAGSQFVDVGIAEETAVALASGIAANGGKPCLWCIQFVCTESL